MRVYYNDQLGRYLVTILRNGEIESTKMVVDAKSWDTSIKHRLANHNRYHRIHGKYLLAHGYVPIESVHGS
jgi:hypothetical protein